VDHTAFLQCHSSTLSTQTMKCSFATALVALLAASAKAEVSVSDPLGTTIALLDDLAVKVKAQSSAAEKAAAEYADWCKSKITNTGFDIETGEAAKEDLEAAVAKTTANVGVESSKIDELSASILADETDLKGAEDVRKTEEATFSSSEAELVDSIETLSRATAILEREMSKNPAALVQLDNTNMESMIKSLTAVINAASFANSDRKKLLALVQARQESDTQDDDSLGAPTAAAYKTHSTSILDVMEDLKEKAEAELADLRKAEMNAKHNFAMLSQSLSDSIAADNKQLADSKASKAKFAGKLAVAEGDLAETVKTLGDDKKTKADTEAKCAAVAADHEASMKGRSDELAAIAEAKKILSETTAGAVSQTYSFLQVVTKQNSQLANHAALANAEIVNLVKKLAKKHHSATLAQLASRIAAVFKYGAQVGEDPFAKVKGLITDLIAKLQSEAGAEASEKAFCDEEIAKTEAKKSELNADIASLTSDIDTASAKSAKLKGEVKDLQADLAKMASSQAEATTIRQTENADYLVAKKDLELGLKGVRQAISVLSAYYGSASFVQQPAAPVSYSKSTGAGTSIIEILEVAESDFAKLLATEETEEADAAATYEQETQEYTISEATKSQDVKYKVREYKGLDKTIAETSATKETSSSELMSVLEYGEKLKERCIAKPETYESRRARREAEIAGLKEALQILETETAFVQRHKRGHRSIFLAPF